MYDGIIFQSPEFTIESSEKKYRFCIVVGKVTNDPVIKQFNKTKVTVNIKYYTKSYLNIVVWGEDEVSYAARSLEKGDVVLCAGTITYSKYFVRQGEFKGEEREWHELNPQFIMSQSMVNALISMFSSSGIQRLLDSEGGDPLESIEDHAEEYEEDSYGADVSYEDAEYEEDDYELGI